MATHGLDERALSRLLEVGQSLVAELDLETVLERVLEVARELTGARYAALGILDQRRTELERFLVSGIDEATHRAIGDLPRGHGMLGELIRDPKPLRLSNLSEHPRSYGFPPAHPPMTTFLGVPILIRGEAWGNLYLTEKDGGPFDERDERTLMVLADWAAVAIANARMYTDMARQRNELQRAVRGLEATTTIAKAVGGETDLRRLLELIVKRARALVEARTVLILLAEGDELRLAAGAGETAMPESDLRVPIADSVAGSVLRSRRPERLSDVRARLHLSLGKFAADPQTALMVPLVFRGQSSGVLVAFDRTTAGPEFSQEDERLLTAFAASAATAVATAQTVHDQRLRESLRAAEAERRRWARELHDETLQGLGALQVMLSAARRSGGEMVDDAIDHLGGEIDRLQALISQLRPAALDEIGLGPALASLADRVPGEFDVSLTIDLDYESGREPTRLDIEIESTIYRTVQEALSNARKHARARRVVVSVTEADGMVVAEVRDDGVGFEVDADRTGFGLVGMAERLALVHGRLEVRSTRGEGTVVRAKVPTRRAAASLDVGEQRRSG
ncbi:MAG: GAF domain-containing sensor histidine kinase [Thermoleophilaceae bacterium]